MVMDDFIQTFNSNIPDVELIKTRYKQRAQLDITDFDALKYRSKMLLSKNGKCEEENILSCLISSTDISFKSVGSIDFHSVELVSSGIKYFASYGDIEIGLRGLDTVCSEIDYTSVQKICNQDIFASFLLFYHLANYENIWLQKQNNVSLIRTANTFIEYDESGVVFEPLFSQILQIES